MEILKYEYGFSEGFVALSLDRKIFTEKLAEIVLKFHSNRWEFEDSEDVVLNACQKIAYHAFYVSTIYEYGVNAVKEEFYSSSLCEGYPPLDGSVGVELIHVERHELDPFEFKLIENEE